MLKQLLAPCLLLAVSPAMACQPALSERNYSDKQIKQLAAREVRNALAVVDGVFAYATDGRLVLKTIRVWRGPQFNFWNIETEECGGAPVLTAGSKVRVILNLDRASSSYRVVDPSFDFTLGNPWRFERALDALIGNARPRNFESVGTVLRPH
jgi:hypothetical protein